MHYKLENVSAKMHVSIWKAGWLLPDYDLKHICSAVADSERESM